MSPIGNLRCLFTEATQINLLNYYMRISNTFLGKNLSGAQTIQLATGIGSLHSIVVGSASVAGSAPFVAVDGNSALTATVATILSLRPGAAEGTYLYDCIFGAGLRIVMPADINVTVNYNIGS